MAWRISFFFFLQCVAAALGWWLWPRVQPAVERMIYLARLTAMPAPQSLPVPVAGVSANALRDTWDAARSGGRRHQAALHEGAEHADAEHDVIHIHGKTGPAVDR